MHHNEPMTPETVFLVEMQDGPAEPLKYWAKVYLSRSKAREGVEYWAPQAGAFRLLWEDTGSGVLIAEDQDSKRIWRVLPLSVHPDSQPERYGTPLPR